MAAFVLFALFLTLFVVAALGALCFVVVTLAEKHQETLELFKAKSLDEKFILETQREQREVLRESTLKELDEIAKKPKVPEMAQTTDGRYIDVTHLRPEFIE